MKKIITLLFAVICIETLFAKKVQIGDLYYLLDTIHQSASVISPTDTISHYKFTPNTTIHIPDSVSYNHITYSVTDIGWSAFFKCEDLSAITLPDSLQHISPFAFVGCTGLTSIKIPKSVKEIGEGAFAGCTGLTSVTIGDSVTNIDGDSFDGCTGLTSPVYNAHKFIYMPRFYTGDYTIPDGIESIANCAFEDCTGLTSIKIPNSVTDIGWLAFKGCTGLRSITIPNSVRIIDFRAFQGCTGLSSITLPNSVTGIGDHAFRGCPCSRFPIYSKRVFAHMPGSYSGDYTIPDGIESIANYAFSYCTDLISVTIPNSVTSIGEYTFEYCTGLRSMTCLALTPPIINSDIFHNVDCSDITLYVPAKSVQAYKDAEQWNIFKEILPTCKFKMRRKAKLLTH